MSANRGKDSSRGEECSVKGNAEYWDSRRHCNLFKPNRTTFLHRWIFADAASTNVNLISLIEIWRDPPSFEPVWLPFHPCEPPLFFCFLVDLCCHSEPGPAAFYHPEWKPTQKLTVCWGLEDAVFEPETRVWCPTQDNSHWDACPSHSYKVISSQLK